MINNEKEAEEYLTNIRKIFDPEIQPYKLLSGKETSQLLGLSYNSFKDTILRNPSFPRIKVGKKFKYPRKEVIEWIGETSKTWYEY